MKNIDYKWRALALLWVAFFLQQGSTALAKCILVFADDHGTAILPQIQNAAALWHGVQ